MVEDSTSSGCSESSETTDLNTTFAESVSWNDLCTPEKLANRSISGIMCSGNIARHDDTIKTVESNNARSDSKSVNDRDDMFLERLKSKIQKDLSLKDEENHEGSPMFPRTGLKCKRRRTHPFDDHSENLMRMFKESLIRDNRVELPKTPVKKPKSSSYTIINYTNPITKNNTGTSGITKPLKNGAEGTTTRKTIRSIKDMFTTPKNVLRIKNIAGKTSSTYSLEVTSTISRKMRSAANKTTLLESETRKVVYRAKF